MPYICPMCKEKTTLQQVDLLRVHLVFGHFGGNPARDDYFLQGQIEIQMEAAIRQSQSSGGRAVPPTVTPAQREMVLATLTDEELRQIGSKLRKAMHQKRLATETEEEKKKRLAHGALIQKRKRDRKKNPPQPTQQPTQPSTRAQRAQRRAKRGN